MVTHQTTITQATAQAAAKAVKAVLQAMAVAGK